MHQAEPPDPAGYGSRRFCFVLPAPERYGPGAGGAIATVTRQVGAALLRAGHQVSVLTPDDGGPVYAAGEVHRLRYGEAHRPPSLVHKAHVVEARLRRWVWADYGSYLRQVRSCIGRLRPRPEVLVVANDPILAAEVQRRWPDTEVVLWLHNLLQGPEARGLGAPPAHLHLVAVSDAVRRWTAINHGIDPDAIGVIHNGVDGEEFHPAEDYLAPRPVLRVICHGRIDPNKGQDAAARAVATLRQWGAPITFTLVGGVRTFGLPEDEVVAYVTRLDRAVADAEGTSLGKVPPTEVAELLRRHDVCCVLSRNPDPMPLTVLEGMASGCAMVTTDLGGLPEAIGDAGILVPPDDPDRLVAALTSLLDDPTVLADWRRRARTRSELFTWDAAAARLLALVGPAGSV